VTVRNCYGDEIDLLGQKPEKYSKGYAAPPGSGPEGETCGSCEYHYIKVMAGKYHKCKLMERIWAGGSGTDIKVRSPACEKWELIK